MKFDQEAALRLLEGLCRSAQLQQRRLLRQAGKTGCRNFGDSRMVLGNLICTA